MSTFQNWFIPDAISTTPGGYALAALLALFLTAFGKGGFGGLGALSVPVLMMVIRPEHATLAVAMWAPILIICDVFTLPFYARQCDWRPILLLAPWTTLGLFLGRLCLDYFRANPAVGNWLKITIGVLSILFALSQAVRYYVALRAEQMPAPWRPAWYHAIPFGLAAGVTTMLAHAAGSIFAMFLIPQQLDRRVFVGTSARYYLIFNTLKLPFFVLAGSAGGSYITAESLRLILWMIPLAPLGVFAGNWLNNNVSNRFFGVAVNVLLALTGVWLIYTNLP